VANTGGTGIVNDGSLNNTGSTIDINAGANVDNYGNLVNGDSGDINIYGTLNNNPASGNVDNDGHITIFAGGEFDNSDTVDNSTGSIFQKCGGTYNGTAPLGNPIIIEPCDTTPPETQITGAFDGKGNQLKATPKKMATTTSTTATFFFIGSDNDGVQKFQCDLDGGGWEDCTSGVTYTNLQAALVHVFQVKAIDLSGNEDPTPAIFNWKINPPKLK
jgi:hypothetical protein